MHEVDILGTDFVSVDRHIKYLHKIWFTFPTQIINDHTSAICVRELLQIQRVIIITKLTSVHNWT